MKFAVFGDMHGNIEALKTAYEAAKAMPGRHGSYLAALRQSHDAAEGF